MEHHAIASGAQMDLYLTSRAFGKNGGRLFARLPPSVKQLATDCGFAHFMLVFEDHTAGTLTQFDFGPHNGADTHITLPGGKKRNRVVPGAVREAQLQKLPDCYLHVGQTALSLDDIRTFNQDQHLPYLLNVNDCRSGDSVRSVAITADASCAQAASMRAYQANRLMRVASKLGHLQKFRNSLKW